MRESRSSPGFAPQSWRNPRRLVVIVALLAIGLVLALRGHRDGPAPAEPVSGPKAAADGFQPTAEQRAALQVLPVSSIVFRTEVVTDGKIALNADTTTPVFSPYSGRVTRTIANLGDRVRRGDPLLTLESSESVQSQNDLISAGAALEAARAQLGQATANEIRKHGLYDAKAGPLQDWEQSKADLVAAQSNWRAAQTTLALTRDKLRILGKSAAEIYVIESSKKIDPTADVVAPIGGIVTDRQVGLGQYIQAGASNPIYTIGNLSRVWLIGNVREADAPQMRLGLPVEAQVLALPNRVFRAKLTYVAPSVDPNTRRLTVRAEVENPDGLLKPEMFASFRILSGGETRAPAVPDSAIIYEGAAAHVWVVHADGSIVAREIQIGLSRDGMAEVLAGVAPGEKIVTSGTLFIDRAAKSE